MPVTSRDDVMSLGTILCVGAHPDDETFMAGGLLSVAAASGQQVICITATKGEGGSQDPVKWPVETIGDIRADELKAALKVLGIGQHHWLDYTDGACAEADANQAAQQLVDYIDQYKPDTILTFGPDGLTGHTDHQAVSGWVSKAVGLSEHKPQVYHALLTTDQYEKYLKVAHDKLNFFFNIDQPPVKPPVECAICFRCSDETCATKQAALAAMPSQYSAMFTAFEKPFLTEAFRVEAFVSA